MTPSDDAIDLVKSQFLAELKIKKNDQSMKVVEGWFSNEVVFDFLLNELYPSSIIEVGTFTGNSACYMHQQLLKLKDDFDIFCVDTFLGSQEHWLNDIYIQKLSFSQGRPDFYQEFLKRAALSNSDHLIPICLPSTTAAKVLRELNKFADLIYIDGAHEYHDVLNDLISYYPLLRLNGILFGDDYHYAPLRKAVHEFAEQKSLELYVHMNKKWVFVDQNMIAFSNKIKSHNNLFTQVL